MRTTKWFAILTMVAMIGVGAASVHADMVLGPNLALRGVEPYADATASSYRVNYGSTSKDDSARKAIDGVDVDDSGFSPTANMWSGWNDAAGYWQMTWTGGPQSFDVIRFTSDATGTNGWAIRNWQLVLDPGTAGETIVTFADDLTQHTGDGQYVLKTTATATTVRLDILSTAGGNHPVLQEFEVYRIVPEPATLALLGVGGVAAGLRRRRA